MRTNRPGFASLMIIGAIVAGAPVSGEQHAVLTRALRAIEARDIGYTAVRYMHAGARDGRHEAWMEVRTRRSASGLDVTIVREGGSDRTREKVFRAVLENEARSAAAGEPSTLNHDNYAMSVEGATNGFTRVRLVPRRKDSRLVDGVLTVGPDGHPVSLEGQLSKSPSFWVRSVTVLTRYARFGEVSLPVSVESMASVRFVGECSFTMRYEYRSLNGRAVSPSRTAVAAPNGPSPQLIALHAAYSGNNQ